MKGMKAILCDNTALLQQDMSRLHCLIYRIGYVAGQAATVRDELAAPLHAGFEHGYAVRSQAAKLKPVSKRVTKRRSFEEATNLAGAVDRG